MSKLHQNTGSLNTNSAIAIQHAIDEERTEKVKLFFNIKNKLL